MSAFFLYSQAFRSQVKTDHPDASFGDVVSRLPSCHGGGHVPTYALRVFLAFLLCAEIVGIAIITFFVMVT